MMTVLQSDTLVRDAHALLSRACDLLAAVADDALDSCDGADWSPWATHTAEVLGEVASASRAVGRLMCENRAPSDVDERAMALVIRVRSQDEHRAAQHGGAVSAWEMV